ncbi:MAG: sugar phosphate nucleotidyltransferase [Candidatus Omnitrophota bacterium]
MEKTKIVAVILTGGSGERFKNSSSLKIPKQFLKIAQKPVFIHCIEAYRRIERLDEILLVINMNYEKVYKRLLKKYGFINNVRRVAGE